MLQRPQGNDAISKFVSGLSGLPAVIKQRVFGTQTDQWEVVLATACQSTPPNFFPVFVTGNDLVVLPLQAPKVCVTCARSHMNFKKRSFVAFQLRRRLLESSMLSRERHRSASRPSPLQLTAMATRCNPNNTRPTMRGSHGVQSRHSSESRPILLRKQYTRTQRGPLRHSDNAWSVLHTAEQLAPGDGINGRTSGSGRERLGRRTSWVRTGGDPQPTTRGRIAPTNPSPPSSDPHPRL
jgi:hypothetical protein